MSHDIWYLSEWLLFNKSGKFLLSFCHVNMMEYKGNFLLVKDSRHAAGTGWEVATIELKNHVVDWIVGSCSLRCLGVILNILEKFATSFIVQKWTSCTTTKFELGKYTTVTFSMYSVVRRF